MSMYQLEITEDEIQTTVKEHLDNHGGEYNPEADKLETQLIKDFASQVKIFYDDDIGRIYDKTANDRYSHHYYRILVTSGKWRVVTEIGLPTMNPDPRYNTMNLSNVISALSFEVNNPEDYMEEDPDSPKYKKAVKRYNHVSQKIYDKFGMDFYCIILGGVT